MGMDRITDIVVGNCITLGVLLYVFTKADLTVTHELHWNGIKDTRYTLNFWKC